MAGQWYVVVSDRQLTLQVRWFAWVEQRLIKEEKELKEWDAAAVLTRYRRKEDMFSGLAYDDISASGPNGGER
jgi:Xaa-Pro aminopeptidase